MPTVYKLLGLETQFFDDNGEPYAGGQLFTYVAGSSTKKTTYQDGDGVTPHANPIDLDAAGRLPAPVFGTTGPYKLVLAPSTDTDPPASPEWTQDDISGINDTASVTLDQWVDSNLTPTYVGATSFTLVGDQTTEFHVGRRLKSQNSGGTRYSTITATSYSAPDTTVTVANDSGSLDAGLSQVSLGLISYVNPSINPAGRLIGVQVITSTATYTPTAGTASVVVEVQGGGGGGGGAQGTTGSQCSAGPGGGAGGYTCERLTSGFGGVTATIGAAGATATGNNAGGNGGTSSFGALCSATGGTGGAAGAAGTGFDAVNGSAGGAGSGGTFNVTGAPGGPSIINPANNGSMSGFGGSSRFGGGGAGKQNTTAGGNAATGYGAGGGGAVCQASASGQTSGAGTAGIIIVWEYA